MAQTNVKQAYVMFNGQKIVATYDAETDLWTAEITAPSESSWNQPGHVFLAEIHAEDLAGNVATMDDSDSTYGDQLKIRVLEKTPPSIQITSPTENAVLGVNAVQVEANVSDSGGSGINRNSIVMKLNGVAVTPSIAAFYDTSEEETSVGTESGEEGTFLDEEAPPVDADGYMEEDPPEDLPSEEEFVEPGSDVDSVSVTYSAENLSDGINNVEITVVDNDGNSTTKSVNFVVSTAGPSLSVDKPTDNLITNSNNLEVSGTVSTSSEYVKISSVIIKVDGMDGSTEYTVTPESTGSFSQNVVIRQGVNTVTVTATDDLGKSTSIARTVTLDVNAPVISDVHAEATTVDVGGVIRIVFRVTDT